MRISKSHSFAEVKLNTRHERRDFPKIMHIKVPRARPNYEARGFLFEPGIYIVLEVHFEISRTTAVEALILITLQLQWTLG